jgi:hypothetical protein
MRICSMCGEPLPIGYENGNPKYPVQQGFYCCDEYYCSQECLDKSFEGTGETWNTHFTEDGDCFWTEWEIEEDE